MATMIFIYMRVQYLLNNCVLEGEEAIIHRLTSYTRGYLNSSVIYHKKNKFKLINNLSLQIEKRREKRRNDSIMNKELIIIMIVIAIINNNNICDDDDDDQLFTTTNYYHNFPSNQ